MNKSKTAQLNRGYTNAQTTPSDTLKIANLSPYIANAQVHFSSKQKRKKIKSLLHDNRSKSKNESSSKSFRIKQKSTTSLHSNSNSKNQISNKTIINLITKKIKQRKKQISPHHKLSSEKYQVFTPSSTFTIKNDHDRTLSRNDAIDVRQNQNNEKKTHAFRRAKFENQSRIQVENIKDVNKQTIEVSKYGTNTFKMGYTDNNIPKKYQSSIVMQNNTQNGEVSEVKKKFRRGKYQELYSSVRSSQMNEVKQQKQIIKSESRLDVIKKQQGIYTQHDDIILERQIQKAHQQNKNKQFHKNIQKSTERYLQQTSSRPIKTNYDIQIYVSITKNPFINRESNKTQKAQISAYSLKNKKERSLLDYDFDYREDDRSFSGITQMSNLTEEESIQLQELTSFEKQRKKALKEYFNKKSPMVDWSQQDCQIDDA